MFVWFVVALRKESVDRNPRSCAESCYPAASLSARRAWIEIKAGNVVDTAVWVALRKESVDRNIIIVYNIDNEISRSPQGERG